MTALGITGTELYTLKARMMFPVTGLEAQVSALDAQIATLASQHDATYRDSCAGHGVESGGTSCTGAKVG